MNRRTFLAAGLTAITAGCASTTGLGTPSEHTVDDGMVTAAMPETIRRDAIQYYDPGTDTLRKLEPQRDHWATARLYVTNNGGSRLPIEDVDRLTHGDVGETIDLIPDPGELREGSMLHPQKELEKRGEYIPAGYSKFLNFLFDAPADAGFTWSYDGTGYPISPKKQN